MNTLSDIQAITYQQWYWMALIAAALACLAVWLVDKACRAWSQMSSAEFISDAELNRFSPGCFLANKPEDHKHE